MDSGLEQEFLSGIEPLSNSETSTPHNSKLRDFMAPIDSLNSTEDPVSYPLLKPGFSPSPVKSSNFSSPIVIADSGSFTTSANEITKHLQESLATSLKKEREAMQSISPGPKKDDSILANHKSPFDNSPSLKSMSPSKLKVHFNDDVTSGTNDDEFQSELRISFLTPPKKNVEVSRVSTISPARRNLSYQMNMEKLPTHKPQTFSETQHSFQLNSLRIPSNEEERQKLFDFMKRMETSSAGDPLSSLFSLEHEINKNSKPATEQMENHARIPTRPVKLNEKRELNLKKRKPDAKKTNSKDPGKRTFKNEPRDLTKKGLPRKTVQKPVNTKSSKAVSKQSRNVDKSAAVKYTSEGQNTINSMETVRNHLQGMLKMEGSSTVGDNERVSEDYKLYFGGNDTKADEDGPESFRSTDTATLLSVQPSDFAFPASSPESTTGDLGGIMNNATSNIFTILRGNQQATKTTRTSVDSSVSVENNILRDTLEKERYRRNHCEKQIQKLQNKILEIQQELAVAQSVARKKDMMIEQLDKTLAKVVDGWKVHEEKLTKSVQQLTQEKEKLKNELVKNEDTINGLQSDALKVIEDYEKMKERLELKEEEQKMLQQTFQMKTHEISRVIDQKNSSIEKLLNDKQTMVEDINNLTKKMEQIQEASENEKEKWTEEMLDQQKNLEEEIQSYKVKFDQEKNRNNDLQKMLSTTQQEVTRLEDLMGSLRQTIDNLKMQGSVEEAKYSAALRKMEAEHQIEIEKKLTDKLSKFHEKTEQKEKQLRDGHHKQVMEITKSHQSELESQCRMYEDRIEQLEHRWRQDLEDKERKFDEILKEKTENLRRQMINKMQNLLQAHYNETLEVVGNTTGNTPLRPSKVGTLSNMLQDMKSSTYLAGSRLHDISNFNGSTMTLQDTLRQNNASSKIGDFMDYSRDKSVPSIVNASSYHPSHLTTSSLSTYQAPTLSTNLSTYTSTVNAEPLKPHATSSLSEISQNIIARNHSDVRNIESNSIPTTGQHEQTIQEEPTQFQTQSTFEAEVNIPMGLTMTPAQILPTNSDSTISPASEQSDRSQYLQHYIKMLLDKSPGEPLDAPHPSTAPLQPIPPPAISTLSPIVVPTQSHVSCEENKENDEKEYIQPNHVTSEMAMDVINFLNKQLKTEPSPDLIPVERTKMQNSPKKQFKQPQPRGTQRSANSAFHQVKMATGTKQQQNNPVKFPSNPVYRSPNKLRQDPHQLSMKDLDVNHSFSKITQKQLSEVSRMLGSYMNGNTQQAAEKLLSYLAESQQKNNHETSLSTSQMSLKSKSKTRTPSKTLPAWR